MFPKRIPNLIMVDIKRIYDFDFDTNDLTKEYFFCINQIVDFCDQFVLQPLTPQIVDIIQKHFDDFHNYLTLHNIIASQVKVIPYSNNLSCQFIEPKKFPVKIKGVY